MPAVGLAGSMLHEPVPPEHLQAAQPVAATCPDEAGPLLQQLPGSPSAPVHLACVLNALSIDMYRMQERRLQELIFIMVKRSTEFYTYSGDNATGYTSGTATGPMYDSAERSKQARPWPPLPYWLLACAEARAFCAARGPTLHVRLWRVRHACYCACRSCSHVQPKLARYP